MALEVHINRACLLLGDAHYRIWCYQLIISNSFNKIEGSLPFDSGILYWALFRSLKELEKLTQMAFHSCVFSSRFQNLFSRVVNKNRQRIP